MAKQIYMVSACDEWKSTDSMRLQMVTTSVRRLKSFIRKKIEGGVFDYGDKNETRKKQAADFALDFDKLPREKVNDKLIYGHFDYAYDGEEI